MGTPVESLILLEQDVASQRVVDIAFDLAHQLSHFLLSSTQEYAKYFKMLSMGLPKDAVKNALTRDGKDPTIMDLDANKSLKSQLQGSAEPKDDGPMLKDDPVGLVLPCGPCYQVLYQPFLITYHFLAASTSKGIRQIFQNAHHGLTKGCCQKCPCTGWQGPHHNGLGCQQELKISAWRKGGTKGRWTNVEG